MTHASHYVPRPEYARLSGLLTAAVSVEIPLTNVNLRYHQELMSSALLHSLSPGAGTYQLCELDAPCHYFMALIYKLLVTLNQNSTLFKNFVLHVYSPDSPSFMASVLMVCMRMRLVIHHVIH